MTEGPGFNVFVVKDGHVSSPDYNVLEGVTRHAVREICEEEGIAFSLRRIHPDEIDEATEIFASTTAGGVMPVTQIIGKPVRNGYPGLVTSRIQALYWSKREQGWHGTRVASILGS